MGLFDWLRGKSNEPEAPAPASARPRPTVLAGLDDDSAFVVLDVGGDGPVVISRDTYDYMYGDSTAPNPAQRDLDRVLPRVTRVCVRGGGTLRGKALPTEELLDVTAPESLRALRGCLRVLEDPRTFKHCSCLGGPTLELFGGTDLLAVIGLHHGQAIRWSRWKHDAVLWDGPALTAWLTAQGLPPEALDILYENRPLPAGFPLARLAPGAAAATRQRVLRAEWLRRTDALEAATAACNELVATAPTVADAFALRSAIRLQQNDFPGVVADATEALRLGSKHAQVPFTRAVAHDALQQPDRALADCDAALALEPSYPVAHHLRAVIHARHGRLAEAIEGLSATIRLAPGWQHPYLQRAELYGAQGNHAGAVDDYTHVLRLLDAGQEGDTEGGPAGKPVTPALVYCLRARAHTHWGDEAKADADFAAAHEQDAPQACRFRGQLRLDRQDFRRAVADFSEVLYLCPGDAAALCGRGAARFGLGDYDGAAADLTEVVGQHPEDVAARVMRGQVYGRQARWEEALADFSEALRVQPSDARVYQGRAHVHGHRGAYTEQLADLESARRLAPEDPVVLNSLAWLRATCPVDALRDGPEALRLAEQAYERTGGQLFFIVDTLAAAYAECGRFDEAARFEEQAVAMAGTDEVRERYRARLAMYQAGKPCRDGYGA
jgi:tetratricopeptide (TPR) repeat protein